MAVAARELLSASDQFREHVVDSIIGDPARQSVTDRIARQLLLRYAERLPSPQKILTNSAIALRILGIYLCACDNNLKHCECLTDLTAQVGEDKLKKTLMCVLEE